jgi:hypothetical protein
MRYADLEFVRHGILNWPDAVREAYESARRMRPALHLPPPPEAVVERAVAVFPNRRRLSVLRGLTGVFALHDLETCRLDVRPLDPIQHASIEEVEAEMYAVAALPPIAAPACPYQQQEHENGR